MGLKKIFGQTVFPIYTLGLLFLAFVGFKGNDPLVAYSAAIAGIASIAGTILEFKPDKGSIISPKGYPIIILTSLFFSLAMFAYMMYSKNFMFAGFIILVSLSIGFSSIFIILPKN